MQTAKPTQALIGLVLFGVSFAYVEAAVVVYLRAIEAPIRREVLGSNPRAELFPLLTVDQLRKAGPEHFHLLVVELGRELATMVMLSAAALAVARNFRQWLGGFLIAFGVWDIFYYVFLKLLVGWPESPWTWDILFLLPVVWVGPVIAPVLVAGAMVVMGTVVLWRESVGRPVALGWFHWTALAGGGLAIVVAFCWDWRNASAGGWPHPFPWPLFAAGLAVGAAGFLHALRIRAKPQGSNLDW